MLAPVDTVWLGVKLAFGLTIGFAILAVLLRLVLPRRDRARHANATETLRPCLSELPLACPRHRALVATGSRLVCSAYQCRWTAPEPRRNDVLTRDVQASYAAPQCNQRQA